ncbi:MAG: restriction endonuclease subunit S, partial [Gammaproteobacteria bacterium]|nr:restriction endonuclease subunit S [Gammaproteobacteria bacterium]
MSKRNKIMLNDIAASGRSVISGPFGSNIGKRFFQETGVPVIRGNNLTTDSKKFVDEGFVFLTEEKADELNAGAIEGDILFTAAGTIGQVGMIPIGSLYKRYVISNKQLRFRVDLNKADPNYVFYWLASPWIFKAIINRNTGSTVPLINLGIIKTLPIEL